MNEPTRNEWMTFSEALEGYLKARDWLNMTDETGSRVMARMEMRACAEQMDYLVGRKDDGND